MRDKKLNRRDFLHLGTLTATTALLAACQGVPAAPQTGDMADAPAEEASLEFWLWNTYAPPADDILEQGLLAWAGDNGVKLEISRDSDSNQLDKVMPALEAGTLPDALFSGSNEAIQLMDAGGLSPLDDVFTEVGEAHGGWLPRLDGYVTREGGIFFLPYSIDTPMVHFRQDIFDEAGITVPEGQWTWEETRDLAMQAQQYTTDQGINMVGWGFGAVKQQHDGWCDDLFRNFGADIWDESGKKVILKDEKSAEAIEALNFAKEAWDMGLFPNDAASWDWSSNNKNYQEEQGILVINAASIFVWAEENKPELAEVTSLAPKPKHIRDTTNAGLRYTVIMSKDTQNREAALNLVKSVYSEDIYAPWLEKGFVTNVLHEYDDLPMWTGKRAQFNLAANIGVYGGYPAPYDTAAMAEVNGPNQPIGSMMVRVLVDDWSPEEAIDEADTFTKRVFDKYA